MQRPGGQSQFPVPSRSLFTQQNPLRLLVDSIGADPARDYSLRSMAQGANVSTRQLTRMFRDELGTTPAPYVESVRLVAAQSFLLAGDSVLTAALRSGFGSDESLRRDFVQRLGVSPSPTGNGSARPGSRSDRAATGRSRFIRLWGAPAPRSR